MFKLDFTSGTIQWAPQTAAGVDVGYRIVFGLSLNEWFYVSVIIYTVAQTVVLLMRNKRESKQCPKD
ncbi:type II holin [Pseudomonas sp. HMWF032]|uniref:type II holin n=1 Tax=Pseudomonas sp. HMWF032 TaxID=2056866 RepID=UPI000D332EB8|nr:type II holin [Pseudomonas sp. HMWF032]PTS86430.1 type II holin [Pseudomonas sp. HMWF032]PTT81381.1 type II holin [Pseudomonas sp. HMWF010]